MPGVYLLSYAGSDHLVQAATVIRRARPELEFTDLTARGSSVKAEEVDGVAVVLFSGSNTWMTACKRWPQVAAGIKVKHWAAGTDGPTPDGTWEITLDRRWDRAANADEVPPVDFDADLCRLIELGHAALHKE